MFEKLYKNLVPLISDIDTNNKTSDSQLFSYGRMILNRLFLSEEYKQYLTFSVEISTNTLITQYSKHLWSDEQEHTHKRIKSLHDSGKGYRTIAKLLNAEGSRTAKNKEWKNSNVYAVLKRYAERQARLERQSYTSEMKFTKMKLEWLKD